MLEDANATIDQIIIRTTNQLYEHRDAGGDDFGFVQKLIHEFVEQGRSAPRGAGSVHMALSVYRMVWQQEKLRQMAEQIAMRDSAIEMLVEIDSL